MTLIWSPPDATLRNGNITGYTVVCSPSPATFSTLSFSQSGRNQVEGLAPNSMYNCSVAAHNSQGTGPATYILFTTEKDCEILALKSYVQC